MELLKLVGGYFSFYHKENNKSITTISALLYLKNQNQFTLNEENKTVISLFAHPDDELGAIGTLANHADRGDNVIMIWTTYGELTTMFPDYSLEEIKKERIKHGEDIAKIVGGRAEFLDLGDSKVDLSRDHRIQVAKKYIEHRPDLVVTWGLSNMHPDHRNTGQLAIDAIKFARINQITDTDKPHRENVVILQYYESGAPFAVKYIDVTDNMEKVKEASQYYANIYKWKNVKDWVTTRRRALGMESFTSYAEKFNIRFDFTKPSKYAL